MKKNLKLLMSSSLITLTFLMFQTHSSQAMEEMEQITFIRSNGGRNRIKVNPDRTLSDLREELTNKQRIKPDDVFQKEGDDIFRDEEKDWKIRDVATNNMLSLKPKRSIFSSKLEKAKEKAPSADFKLEVPVSEDIKFYEPQRSVATTTNMDSYALLSGQDRHSLIESLRLTSAIDLTHIDSFDEESKDIALEPSFRTSVIWQKKPDWQNPYRTLVMNTSFSLSKSSHELRKSNITKGTAGADCLGISFDLEYKSKSTTLKNKEETEIYLLSTYEVPKIVLSIHKDDINAHPNLEKKIEKIFNRNRQEIDLYRELISVFRDYGFCVPTRFVLGGQLYSEDKKTASSIDDAKLAEADFAGAMKASFFVASVSADGGYVNVESEKSSQSHMTQAVQKLVTGGDPSLTNDLSQWIASLGSWRQWRIIERGDFYPIIGFLRADLQTKCKSLIAKYYQGNSKQISLAALNATLIDIEQPLRSPFLNQKIISQIENQEPSRIKIQNMEKTLAAVTVAAEAMGKSIEELKKQLIYIKKEVEIKQNIKEPQNIKEEKIKVSEKQSSSQEEAKKPDNIKITIEPVSQDARSISAVNASFFEEWRAGLLSINKQWAEIVWKEWSKEDCASLRLLRAQMGDGEGGIRELAKILVKNPPLTNLVLMRDWIGEEEAVGISSILKASSTLTTLSLEDNKIGDEDVAIIAKALATNSTLTILNLRNNNIEEDGARAIAKALTINSTLTSLDLESNKIGDEGGIAIGNVLATNSTLTTLSLGYNKIGDEGAGVVGNALATNSTLTTLNLNDNNIRSEGASAISNALTTNSTLTTLNLAYDKIGDEGGIAIGNALATNSFLTTLNLQACNIKDEGANAIANGLKTNVSLKILNLKNNDNLSGIMKKTIKKSKNRQLKIEF